MQIVYGITKTMEARSAAGMPERSAARAGAWALPQTAVKAARWRTPNFTIRWPATWTPTGNRNVARANQTATLLQNGLVLVVRGAAGSVINNSGVITELYDPVAGTWSATGGLITDRTGHTATLLANRTVLVAGGIGENGGVVVLASAEIYDPIAGTWSATGSLITARTSHAAIMLEEFPALRTSGSNAVPSSAGGIAQRELTARVATETHLRLSPRRAAMQPVS